jgi:hypothetical protein
MGSVKKFSVKQRLSNDKARGTTLGSLATYASDCPATIASMCEEEIYAK